MDASRRGGVFVPAVAVMQYLPELQNASQAADWVIVFNRGSLGVFTMSSRAPFGYRYVGMAFFKR